MRQGIFKAAGLLALWAACLTAGAAQAAPWAIDRKHTYVLFEVVHLGLIPYPGRFTRVSIDLDYVPEDVERSSVDVRIPVKSIQTDNGLMNETLLSEQFFDERNFQEIRFKSTRIEKTGETTGYIHGELTMKGNTHPVRMDAIFAGEAKDPFFGGKRIGIMAELKLDRIKWGLAAWRGFVDREVTIRIGLEATPE